MTLIERFAVGSIECQIVPDGVVMPIRVLISATGNFTIHVGPAGGVDVNMSCNSGRGWVVRTVGIAHPSLAE